VKTSLVIAACGVAILVGLCMPVSAAAGSPAWFTVAWESERIHAVLLALGAGLAIVIGAWGATRRQLWRWQAIAATGGFGVVFLKVQIYRGLTRVPWAPASVKILTAAVLIGLAASIIAIVLADE
jgi:hypothetical protein